MRSAQTPRLRIELACEQLGQSEVVRRCLRLLTGVTDDPHLIVTLGGAPAARLLDDGIPPGHRYWVRVWAARGLLWAGPGDDYDILRMALTDDSWRVRELTCKVVARYRVGDLLEDVAALEADPVNRVRSAAARATTRIVESRA
jgi:HEAT repeat protein